MSTGCGLEDEDFGLDMLEVGQAPATRSSCGTSCTSGCGARCGSAADANTEALNKQQTPVFAGSDCGSATGGSDAKAEAFDQQQMSVHAAKVKLGGTSCIKCRERPAQLVGNLKEPMCGLCLRAILVGKLKTTINKHSLVVRHDRLLVGFSGGHSSRAALELLACIQSHATTEAAALAERGRIVFDLDVVFVDKSAVLGKLGNRELELDGISAVVAKYNGVHLHIVKLEDIFDGEEEEVKSDSEKVGLGQDRENSFAQVEGASSSSHLAKLQELFKNVKDTTGREDLIEFLQRQLILRVAKLQGCTKVVLADSISRTAARVLASVVKGRGFSMPGDIQYVDTRWHTPIIWPLRDCMGRDLALFCHLEGLETVFVPSVTTLKGTRGATINSLTDTFVRKLQQDNMSRESTIVRTAHKLTPFLFNATETLPIPPSPWLAPSEQGGLEARGEDKHNSPRVEEVRRSELVATAANSHPELAATTLAETTTPLSIRAEHALPVRDGGAHSVCSDGVGGVTGSCQIISGEEDLPDAFQMVGCCICGAPFGDAEGSSFETTLAEMMNAQTGAHARAPNSALKGSGFKNGCAKEVGDVDSAMCSGLSAAMIAENSVRDDRPEVGSAVVLSEMQAEGGQRHSSDNREGRFEGNVRGKVSCLSLASCLCCKLQVLGTKGGDAEEVVVAAELLPKVITDRAMKMVCECESDRRTWAKSHIKGFLLEDDVDEDMA